MLFDSVFLLKETELEDDNLSGFRFDYRQLCPVRRRDLRHRDRARTARPRSAAACSGEPGWSGFPVTGLARSCVRPARPLGSLEDRSASFRDDARDRVVLGDVE